MKVIELLVKIANNEEVPYIIKYNGRIYEYVEEIKWYLRDDLKCDLSNSKKCLNDYVEVIEDTTEKKNIKEIFALNTDSYAEDVYYEKLSKEEICLDIQSLKHKINEIIDKVNVEK